MNTITYILLAVVFFVLMAGIYTLFRGDEVARSWSNKLMRARVFFQFLTILVIVLGFWLKDNWMAG